MIDEEEYREAEAQLLASLELSRALYGELDVDTIETKDSLVCLYMARQNWAAAEELAREVLQQLSTRHSNDMDAAIYRTRYARILYASTEYERAFQEANAALTILGGITRHDHQLIGSAKQVIADVLVQIGDYREGELFARESLEIWKKNHSEPWRSARAASTLGASLLKQGKLAEAEQYLGYAARILEEQAGYMQRDARMENDRRIAELDAAKQSARTR